MVSRNFIGRALLAAATACASFSASADLARLGPIDNPAPPGNGFPLWYQDLNGLVLDRCLTDATDPGALQQTACLLTTAPPYTFPTAFPPEMFYYRAVSDRLCTKTDSAGNCVKTAVLVLALEGSFASGTAQAGQQIVFTRIRVTAGVPFPGTYTINHPYGTDVQTVDSVSSGNRDIFFTIDRGTAPGVFTDALVSRVGPFLQGSTQPGGLPNPPVTLNGAQFLGDGVLPTPVTGSPFQNPLVPVPPVPASAGPGNWFEMCGPFDGTAQPDRCVRQELFTLTGRVHNLVTSPIASPLSVQRATYSRDTLDNVTIDVSATAIAGIGQAQPKLSVGSQDVPPVLMVGPDTPNLGHYYARGLPVPPTLLSTQVTVTNSGDNPPSSVTTRIVDEVAVSRADYDAGLQTVTVVATSSDSRIGGRLTLEGYPGAQKSIADPDPQGCNSSPACVKFVATGVIVPPPGVAVSSSAGGRGTMDVTMTGVATFGAGVVYAQDDVVITTAGAGPVIVNVLLNDTMPAGAPAQSLTIVSPPAIGSAVVNLTIPPTITYSPPLVATGTTTFTYTTGNSVGQSNVATVTVDVGASANPIPTANPDSASVGAGNSVVINVLANDTGNGGTLNPASVRVTTAPGSGTATVNTTTGAITYAAPANAPTATVTFAYAVKDTATAANPNPIESAPATVSVAVTVAETLTTTSPKCTNPNAWDVRGTSTNLTGTITLYNTATVPAAPTAAQTIATVPITAGKWQFRGNSAACSTRMSVQTGTGTKLENQVVTVR